MDDPGYVIPENLAQAILEQTIYERRCAEFLTCLFEGGSATIDAFTGKLILVSGDLLKGMQ